MLASKQLSRRHLVLVVEDQEINRDVLGAILEDDYDVIYAENGAEGLETMHREREKLSIVLLDLMMPVVAEGVETEEQLRLLRQAGCQIVQGYSFSRPIPAEEMDQRINKQIALDRRQDT